MKIGIDIQAALPLHRSGIGTYVFNLIKYLSQTDSKNNYFLIKPPGKDTHAIDQFLVNQNFKIRSQINLINFVPALDLFHGPDFKLINVSAKKKAVTIHDLGCFVNNDFMSKEFEELTRKKIIKSIRQADIIITVSDSIKQQVEELFPKTKGRVKFVHHGISEEINFVDNKEKIRSVMKKYDIRKPYILFVGNIENRKNISTLLNAFKKIEDKTDHQLVLIGRGGHGSEKIQLLFNKLSFGDKAKLIGWADYDDLALLYSAADFFVFPSWYEGFGFPVLEAMKCHTPTIISDIQTHREIAGDASIFFDPKNDDELAEVMIKLIPDESLKQKLGTKGIERAKLFTWENSVQQMINIYEC